MAVKLGKPIEKETLSMKLERFVIKHANIILPLAFIVLIILFVTLCYAIVGVSAVESGAMRNFMNGGYL